MDIQSQSVPPVTPEMPTETPAEGEKPTAEGEKRVYEPGEEEKKIDFSARFAALSKRERELQAKERAIKEKTSKLSEWEEAKKNAMEDPVKFMEAHGLSYKQLTDFILSDDAKEPTTDDKIKKLEQALEEERQARIEEKKRAEKEAKAAEEAKIIEGYKKEIQTHIDSNPDDFELVRLTDNYDLVYSVAEEYFEKSGQIMNVADAAKYVEDHLTKEAQEKILKAKKFRQSSETSEEPSSLAEKFEAARQKASTPTLTNDFATEGGNPVNPNVPSWVDAEESKKRAAAFLEAQLRKQR